MHRIRVGGAWQAANTRRVYQGGAWRTVRKAWVYASGAWRQYYIGASPLTVSFNPPAPSFISFENDTVSGEISAIISGGLAPFTYAWSVLAFTAPPAPAFSSPLSATTLVVQGNVGLGSTVSATLQVVVTDSVGQSATASVASQFRNISFS